MAAAPLFAPEEIEFIETVGLHFDAIGLPRIAGRIFGLLVVSPRPLLLNEIAQALGISRASVSINTRMFISNGSMEVRAVPGDRRQYYAMREDVFVSRLPFLRQMFRRLGEVFRQAELAVEAGETLRSSGQGGLGAAESTDAWEGALRSADAPGLRVQRGLVFLGFVEAQLEEMETRFRSMQRERS